MNSSRQLMKRYGQSYYLATLFFPKSIAQDVIELYKFVRIPDQVVDGDVVDNEGKLVVVGSVAHYQKARIELQKMLAERTIAYTNKDTKHTTRGSAVELFYRKEIPFEYSESFFEAMLSDTQKHYYQTYKELQEYMYGSACVVGLMMCHIIGCDKKALQYASLLGEAMQLSNFLRDIREDYELLGRIYMPEQILQKYSLTHQDLVTIIKSQTPDKRFTECMKDLVAFNRDQYKKSMTGIKLLHPKGRKAVYMAAILYEGILDKIEANNYDVLSASCRTSRRDKTKLLTKGLISYIQF